MFNRPCDYYTWAAKVVAHMRLATSLEKGAPNMEMIALNCKKEMIDFVSFYRRFTNVSGKQSFSTLYTAINVLHQAQEDQAQEEEGQTSCAQVLPGGCLRQGD